ncbi:uncharacterized protein LOC111352598 [Spodoptera litura]|uniref:Uncharacterized protein LOC111352598 n=1 Tax=Spodoptera litura TaxID=69820 RepID=A0A9J7E239_SPOLT|nr:uncharacterized protein LOC111352598 [Spodoptera litura]
MGPKPKVEVVKKLAPPVVRPAISQSSLVFVPRDVLEGFQERIETDIDWTVTESSCRFHRAQYKKNDDAKVTFSQALKNKISRSIISGFLNKDSGLTLEQNWEFLLPITLWDTENFATDEGKICFDNENCVTDDLMKLIKNAVDAGDRNVLKNELMMVNVLRVNGMQMTELDETLTRYKKLTTLNLCGNWLTELNATFIPQTLKALELHNNCISDVSAFAESLPFDLLYLGLSRNMLTTENIDALGHLPYNLTVLDLADNDIYHLTPVIDAVSRLPNLCALQLSGNPCALCTGYARTCLLKLSRLKWLDCREVLDSDRPLEFTEVHPDDLRSAYFHFTVFRIVSCPQPPKPEKGASTSFHIELELPLLDVVRRKFLMFRRPESLVELLPPPEDEEWPNTAGASVPAIGSKIQASGIIQDEQSSHGSDIFNNMVPKNTREIHNYTTFESSKVQWNKLMNFNEPVVKIFCPDLVALRDTFRSAITIRLVYSIVYTPPKAGKTEKQKSLSTIKPPGEMRVNIATIRCCLRAPDWSQQSQHFHWDETLGTSDAIHWGDGDLAVLQYSQGPVKVTKGKVDAEMGSRQNMPEFLTCHFGFGIDTLRTT